MKTHQVYAIINSLTFDAYVGCTTQSLGSRISTHIKKLATGVHPSSRLQEAWSQYGEGTFQFAVLLDLGPVTQETARTIELVWIGKLGTYNEIGADGWSSSMRDNRGAHSAEFWADPKHRAEHSERMKSIWADPEQRKVYDDRRTRWVDPDQAAKHSEHMKALWADPSRREKLEARRAARWADPEAKARHSEKMRAYHAARRARLQDV
jgi:hypothetical protein